MYFAARPGGRAICRSSRATAREPVRQQGSPRSGASRICRRAASWSGGAFGCALRGQSQVLSAASDDTVIKIAVPSHRARCEQSAGPRGTAILIAVSSLAALGAVALAAKRAPERASHQLAARLQILETPERGDHLLAHLVGVPGGSRRSRGAEVLRRKYMSDDSRMLVPHAKSRFDRKNQIHAHTESEVHIHENDTRSKKIDGLSRVETAGRSRR